MKIYNYEVTTDDPAQVVPPYAVSITITTIENLNYTVEDLETLQTSAEEIEQRVAAEIEELRDEQAKEAMVIGKRRRFLWGLLA